MSLPLYGGPWSIKQAAHLLRRATFGSNKTQIDLFAGMGRIGAINALFPGNNAAPPAPVLPIDPKTGTEWFLSGTTDANSEDADLQGFFHGWFIGQMLSDNVAVSAREKIVWFLHTHFTAITSKISNSRSLYFQNELFRIYSRDEYSNQAYMNIKELTVKVSLDNAMLRLLDGDLNVKGSDNENYARELLELYTIGRGVERLVPPVTEEGDYFYFTEQDVEQAAKVLTGWTIDTDFATLDTDTNLPRGKVRGTINNASGHDNEIKTFSARFGGATIQPDPTLLSPNGDPTELSAIQEIRDLIDLIYDQRATLKNICWKIYRFYVWGPHQFQEDKIKEIDETIIEGMADTLGQNFKILPVIKELLSSEHFYRETSAITDNNIGALIKSPVDLALGTMRFFNVNLPDMISAPTEFYAATAMILDSFQEQGLNFYEPYDVAGYEAFHQYPVYHRFWITPNYLANRYNLIRSMVGNASSPLWIDTYNFIIDNFGEEPDADILIANIARYIYPIVSDNDSSTITESRAAYFKARFLNMMPEDYWITNPGEAREFTDALINVMLQTPEYQLS